MEFFYRYDFFGESTLSVSATKEDLDDGFYEALLSADFEFCSDDLYYYGEYGIEPKLKAYKREAGSSKKPLNLRFSGDYLFFALRALEILAENSQKYNDVLAVVEKVRRMEGEDSELLN